ncbi:TetR/AcrR family transcriptional regulator [Yoonia sediminilitoris]|uniref:TetR family transcriptional regulator n=1 Tax=Yoonia sediminilitoris TaxID=1286148 RepID=A0A2T6K132_9RHOB|nr:TetR/AcrR family transcriptional regulator [Yoonia sediminilitoris]PUB08340.1 TetR family transcriptional regulator [Yoonia sediminilitoris]RCW89425.1 TetR family transcriptional regulator [Yoonia sediminilitoris]
MTRRRKNFRPEDRRNQIFDCAQQLFQTKGYSRTSINDIMNIAGVSKGAFYHHFDSKEAMVDGLLRRYADQIRGAYDAVLETQGLSALDRYKLHLQILRDRQALAEPQSMMLIIASLLNEEDSGFQDRLMEEIVAAVVPVFAEVLRLGIEDGVFLIDDPVTAAPLIVRIANQHRYVLKTAFGIKSAEDQKAVVKKIEDSLKMQGLAIDRLLGIPDGTTQLRHVNYASDFVANLHAK